MGSFGYIFIRDGFRSDTLGRWVCIFFAAPLDARRGKGGHVCSRYRPICAWRVNEVEQKSQVPALYPAALGGPAGALTSGLEMDGRLCTEPGVDCCV